MLNVSNVASMISESVNNSEGLLSMNVLNLNIVLHKIKNGDIVSLESLYELINAAKNTSHFNDIIEFVNTYNFQILYPKDIFEVCSKFEFLNPISRFSKDCRLINFIKEDKNASLSLNILDNVTSSKIEAIFNSFLNNNDGDKTAHNNNEGDYKNDDKSETNVAYKEDANMRNDKVEEDKETTHNNEGDYKNDNKSETNVAYKEDANMRNDKVEEDKDNVYSNTANDNSAVLESSKDEEYIKENEQKSHNNIEDSIIDSLQNALQILFKTEIENGVEKVNANINEVKLLLETLISEKKMNYDKKDLEEEDLDQLNNYDKEETKENSYSTYEEEEEDKEDEEDEEKEDNENYKQDAENNPENMNQVEEESSEEDEDSSVEDDENTYTKDNNNNKDNQNMPSYIEEYLSEVKTKYNDLEEKYGSLQNQYDALKESISALSSYLDESLNNINNIDLDKINEIYSSIEELKEVYNNMQFQISEESIETIKDQVLNEVLDNVLKEVSELLSVNKQEVSIEISSIRDDLNKLISKMDNIALTPQPQQVNNNVFSNQNNVLEEQNKEDASKKTEAQDLFAAEESDLEEETKTQGAKINKSKFNPSGKQLIMIVAGAILIVLAILIIAAKIIF